MKNKNSKADKSAVTLARHIKLIIGIGNPGKEYQNTYHNAGLLAVDCLRGKFPGLSFLKSTAYMNESGSFIAETLKKTGVEPERVLIMHDDSDIKLGESKLSFGRGSAGHNGIESIIKSLKTNNFWRFRIGIRAKHLIERTRVRNRIKAGDFVLKKITKKDRESLYRALEEARPKIKAILD